MNRITQITRMSASRFNEETRHAPCFGISKPRSLVAIPVLCLIAAMGCAQSTSTSTERLTPGASSRQARASVALQAAMKELPLSFQPDIRKNSDPVRFLASGEGYRLYLSPTLAEMEIARRNRRSDADLRMSITGANPHAQAVGLDRLRAITNYIVDGDPQHSRINVPNFAKVAYRNVYPGVDLSYYGNHGQLEYDFVVAPRANPEQIKLMFPGITGMRVDASTGDLVITTRDGSEIRHQRPQVYQRIAGRKATIDGRYHVTGANSVGFTLGKYDHALPLIIDPTVTFTRFIEGTGTDYPTAITVDSSGNTYITGETDSLRGFPYGGNINVVTDKLPQKNCGAAGGTGYACPNAAFLVKINSAGAIVAYSYFGGSAFDLPLAITTDDTWVYVAGETTSSKFNDAYTDPAESGPLKINGTPYASGNVNAFVAVFEPNMIPYKYMTFGGTGLNSAHAIAVDAAHFIYVAGATCTADFPTSALLSKSVLQPTAGGGCDGYVMKMDLHGSIQAGYSTYLGGVNNDIASAIAVESDGSAWVTGYTCSADFPGARLNPVSTGDLTAGGCTAFVTKLAPTGASAEVSMFLGGRRTLNPQTNDFIYPSDFGTAIAVAPGGGVVVVGGTYSPNFYTTSDSAVQKTNPACLLGEKGDCESGWVARIGATGSVFYSTYLGGAGSSSATTVAVNHNSQVYVGGITSTYVGFPGAPAIAPNPTAGYVTRLPDNLNTVSWTTFLGEEIHGLVARQPSPVRFPTGAPPTTIYTTGVRLVPKGTNPKLDATAGTDGFVVQLVDGSAGIAAGPR